MQKDVPRSPLSTLAHTAANQGGADLLRKMATSSSTLIVKTLHSRDENGWSPLHEAARGGHTDAVRVLLEQGGVDPNLRTNGDRGGTALYWAVKNHGEDHPVTLMLREHGALETGPEKRKEKKEG